MCLACVGLGASPEEGTETVHTVEQIRIPVTDITTVTVEPKSIEVLPKACADIVLESANQREGYRKLSQTMAELTRIIDDAGKVVYTKDSNEVVRLSNRWTQMQREQSEAWELIGTADANITRLLPNCPR